MLTVCRFCLNDDEVGLCLLTESVDSFVAIEDVELLTGIQLNAEELDSYAVCCECLEQLKKSTAFRDLCLSNDAHFRQLYSTQYIKMELASVEIEFVSRSTFEDVSTDDKPPPFSRNVNRFPTDELDIKSETDDHCSISSIVLGQSPEGQQNLNDDEQDEEPQQYSAHSALTIPFKIKPEAASTIPEVYSKNNNRSRNGNAQRQLCNMCGKMVTNITLHISSHKKETNYTCPHCPTKMTHPANLMRHIKAVHLKTIVKTCDLCGKGFTHKNTYKSHLRSQHDIGESYECKMCTKLFKYPSGLRDHVKRFHTSDSNYECVVCDKTFKTKQALKAHENVHTNAKTFCCKHCPKQFKSRSARNTHQLTHSGIIFSCEFCNKSYRYKTLLNIHVRKNHQLNTAESEQDCE